MKTKKLSYLISEDPMKRFARVFSAAAIAVLMFTSFASAKWWIFGQSADEVVIRHLYLNNVSFEEGGPAVTLLADQLPGGLIVIKGKATAGSAKIGAAQVSLDNKVTWEKAKLSKDGAFEYSFPAQKGSTYDLYVKVLDTRGKTNDLEQAHKKVTVSAADVSTLVNETLDGMMKAYSDKNLRGFMDYVSRDFVTDPSLVERSIQRDFSAFDQISLRYTINNVTRDSKGYIAVSITYTRSVVSIKSGQTLTDTGITQFNFTLNDGGLKAYSMKTPLIFGVSDPENVATSAVNSAANSGAGISIDPATGNVTQGGLGGFSGGLTASMTYNNTGFLLTWWSQSFSFAMGSVAQEAFGSAAPVSGDFKLYGDNHHLVTASGVTYIDMGAASLSSITTAPTGGYVAANGSVNVTAGNCYVFKLPGGAYGAIQVISANIPVTTFKYKYSASGPSF
jgi:hypothetical protein